MNQKTKIVTGAALILVSLGVLLVWQSLSLGKLRFIFCDVGQGDTILIITPDGKQILVDGGLGSKVVDCLSSHMPFWDRSVEMVINTHPQQDHLEGLVSVLEKYEVGMIATNGVVNSTNLYGQWEKAVKKEEGPKGTEGSKGTKGAKMYTAKAGDKLILDQGSAYSRVAPLTMEVLWPPADKIENWQKEPPKDLNVSSIIVRISYGPPAGGFCAYLTGDIPKEILETVADKQCQILKVTHHGSKTGTNEQLLAKIKPKIAVIQVGKNNRFGHPHKEVLDLLASRNIKVLRNDLSGTIEVDVGREGIRVKTQKK